MLPLQARVDLGVMAMKKYSAFPKTPTLLQPHHQIVILRTLTGGGSYHSAKMQSVYSAAQIHNFSHSDYLLNHQRSTWKKIESTLLFIDFFKAFDSICRGKMEQMLLVCGLLKVTVLHSKYLSSLSNCFFNILCFFHPVRYFVHILSLSLSEVKTKGRNIYQ